jgi:hypothetical protein
MSWSYWKHGMSTLVLEVEPLAVGVRVTDDELIADLTDGRSMHVPLAWYPRLFHAATVEREHWELLGDGYAIEWPDLDEHTGVEGLLAGRHSGESPQSLKRWLASLATPISRLAAQMRIYRLEVGLYDLAMGQRLFTGDGADHVVLDARMVAGEMTNAQLVNQGLCSSYEELAFHDRGLRKRSYSANDLDTTSALASSPRTSCRPSQALELSGRCPGGMFQ